MKVVSVINYKGGVGKTSLTTNLAAELAYRNHRVLMIDLDAQASLTFSFITPDEWSNNFEDDKTIKSWFDSHELGNPSSLSELVYQPPRAARPLKGRGQLDLICSHLGLINVDLELATKLGGATLSQAKQNFLSIHGRLAEGLVEMRDNYDVILIDCPPNFNIVTKTAIVASDYILVPARPDFLSTLGIDYLMRSMNGLVRDYNEYADLAQGVQSEPIDPKIVGIVFTMIQEYGGGPMASHRQFMHQVRNNSDLSVFDAYIKRNDTIFADAPQTGVPVVLVGYANGSHSSVVDGLEAVTTEFAANIGI